MTASESRAKRIADGIYRIDLRFLGGPGAVASYLVEGPGSLALIETGPSTVQDELDAGVRAAGFELADINQVILTHIHLDHAGGAGGLARANPNLKVWVHPVGAPHLVDNARLLKSAARIYGDDMERLWGDVENVPESQVRIVEERVPIDVGGRMIVPYSTPGHASHHLAFLDTQTGTLFAGDVAGVRLQGSDAVVPPMPPPDIDLAAWRESIDLMRSIAPNQLVLTHFGEFEDVDRHLTVLCENIDTVMALGRDVLVGGGSDDTLTRRLEAWLAEVFGDDSARGERMMSAANPMFMTSLGIHRVLRKAGELER